MTGVVDAGDFSNEAIAVLGDRFDVVARVASVAERAPDGVDHLADVSVFDEDVRPHGRQNLLLRDEGTTVTHEMHERAERLLGNDEAPAAGPARERALANVQLEVAERVHLARPFSHGAAPRIHQDRPHVLLKKLHALRRRRRPLRRKSQRRD